MNNMRQSQQDFCQINADTLPTFTIMVKSFFPNGVLVMDIQSNNESTIKVIGEKQYQHNAYVMQGFEYIPVMDGESLTSVTPIQITGPIFNTEGIYDFKMELLTLDNHDNWVFGLSGFHSQITIGKDVIWEDSIVKNQLP